jgi:hypothetical protein
VRLYEVIVWGVTHDDEPDRYYLACARDAASCHALVAARDPRVGGMRELVPCTADVAAPLIVAGPYADSLFSRSASWTGWSYDDLLETWGAEPNSWGGTVEAYHPNGHLAARGTMVEQQKHGTFQQWYPDGTLMHTGRYRRGTVTGFHEWWYANGQLARSAHYERRTIASSTWDRAGNLIHEEVHRLDEPPIADDPREP